MMDGLGEWDFIQSLESSRTLGVREGIPSSSGIRGLGSVFRGKLEGARKRGGPVLSLASAMWP